MSELEIAQWLIDNLGVHGAVGFPLDLIKFSEHAAKLHGISRNKDADPSGIVECLRGIQSAIGPHHMEMMFDTPHDVDDFWVSHWCPQPADCRLEAAVCPAGTIPLWTNGIITVFARRTEDKHGNDEFLFGQMEH